YTQPSPGLPNPGTVGSSLTLRVTEVNFNPPKGSGGQSTDYEFVEFKNTGGSTINLNGVTVSGAMGYTFGDVARGAGQFIVIVKDRAAFASRFGTGINLADGTYTDALNDNGGQIRLSDA